MRKLAILLLLAFSSSVPALTKGPVDDQSSPAAELQLPGMLEQTIPTEPVKPVTPPAQQEPQAAAPTQPKVESGFTTELDKLTEEHTILEQREKNAKLRESIKQHGGYAEEDKQTTTSTEAGNNKFSVRLIYGVGGLYHAIILNNGVELTVGQGANIDGNWKVALISARTVQLKNKDGDTLNLSLSGAIQEQKPRTTPQQRQPQQNNMVQPVLPQSLLPGQTAQ